MSKVTFFANYLTANRAICKKDGDICRFYSPEGAYLGKQIKIYQPPLTVFMRHIYDHKQEPFYIENLTVNKGVIVAKNKQNKLGIVTVHSRIFRQLCDFLQNTMTFINTERKLQNQFIKIGTIEPTKTEVFDIIGKPQYEYNVLDAGSVHPLPEKAQIKFMTN